MPVTPPNKISVKFSFTALSIHIDIVSLLQGQRTVPTCTLPGAKIHPSSPSPVTMSSCFSSSGWNNNWQLNRAAGGFAGKQISPSQDLKHSSFIKKNFLLTHLINARKCIVAESVDSEFGCFKWARWFWNNKCFFMSSATILFLWFQFNLELKLQKEDVN